MDGDPSIDPEKRLSPLEAAEQARSEDLTEIWKALQNAEACGLIHSNMVNPLINLYSKHGRTIIEAFKSTEDK